MVFALAESAARIAFRYYSRAEEWRLYVVSRAEKDSDAVRTATARAEDALKRYRRAAALLQKGAA